MIQIITGTGLFPLTLIFISGIRSYDISLPNQTATIVADPSLDYNTVLRTIKETGKEIRSGEADGVQQRIELVE